MLSEISTLKASVVPGDTATADRLVVLAGITVTSAGSPFALSWSKRDMTSVVRQAHHERVEYVIIIAARST